VLPGGLLRIDVFFHPAFWCILYQLPVACIASYLGVARQVEDRPVGAQMWKLIAATGVAGTMLFQLVLWVLPGIIGLLAAAVAMYVLIMVAVDKLLLLHLEHAHSVTWHICLVTWVLWAVIGAVVMILRAL